MPGAINAPCPLQELCWEKHFSFPFVSLFQVGGVSCQGCKFNEHLLAQRLQSELIREQSSGLLHYRNSKCMIRLFRSTQVDSSTTSSRNNALSPNYLPFSRQRCFFSPNQVAHRIKTTPKFRLLCPWGQQGTQGGSGGTKGSDMEKGSPLISVSEGKSLNGLR